jgi:replicative DNA helicase
MAPTNRGKSWWLMHLGKWALLQRQSVLHITLEMSEPKTAARYLQSFFSITKRQAPTRLPKFIRNSEGGVIDVNYEELTRPSFADVDIRAKLSSKIRREFRRRPKLKIKGFPSGKLTLAMLEAYLDNLARFENFTPDVLIVDYADLMSIKDVKNLRQELGAISVGLRGIGVERNMAVITASQTNREGINARVVDETNMSEDISKAFTADVLLTYNQTAAEYAMGLARIYVAKNRDDETKMMALITQAYAMGQFCLDSSPLMPQYWDLVGTPTQHRTEEPPPPQSTRRRRT